MQVRVPLTAFPVTYKYALVRTSGATLLEVGENRLAGLGTAGRDAGGRPPSLLVTDDGPLRRPARWRGAALAAPVFALRTRRSVGAGEFTDLKALVDVCNAAGARACGAAVSSGTAVARHKCRQGTACSALCPHADWWRVWPRSH